MTDELTKTFFDTFGIEPKFKGYSNTEELATGGIIPCGNIKYFNTIEEMDKANYWCFNMWELDEEDKDYPQITDRILLGLICINEDEQPNIEWLKQCVLENLIHRFDKNIFCDKEQAVKQVRTLFEEG